MPRASSVRSLVPGFLVMLAVLVGGCGTPCEQLSAAMCDGGDAETCAKIDAWLQTRLVDPQTKEALQGQPRDQMCSAIHKNVEMFNAYRFKAKQKVLGEPDFMLASQKKALEEAAAYEEAKAAQVTAKKEGEDEEPSPGGANMSD